MVQSEKPLLLFKGQLETECSKIERDYDLERRGHSLIWWYFKTFNNYSDEKIDELICDDYGDLGIDAIDIDTDKYVHFYQFKNPESITAGFDGGDIDKIFSGLNLIIRRGYRSVANEDLIKRIDEILQILPNGYKLHLVISSNASLGVEAVTKLNSFIESVGGSHFFNWSFENLTWLWDTFYTKKLPTMTDEIIFDNITNPFAIRTSDHEHFIFSLSGVVLAQLYDKYGENLLQQNIRVFEGDKPANRAIEHTCTSPDSANFFHYNNGITFLCDSGNYDIFRHSIILKKAQIVNGGQTIRVLYNAYRYKTLKEDVSVLTRAIISQGDKDFANNVAVNLNNQTTVDPSFLKSNDPRILQLSHSLASQGWYLERREHEIDQLSTEEIELVEKRIGSSLEGRVIPIKEGAQSYVAIYLRCLELAKKNPKKIFQEHNSDGLFDSVFSDKLTTEKFINSYKIYSAQKRLVSEFGKLKRKKSRFGNWKQEYAKLLGRDLVQFNGANLDQVIPQSAIFISALIYWNYVELHHQPIEQVISKLDSSFDLQIESLSNIFAFSKDNPGEITKNWALLLREQSFFDKVMEYLKEKG